jgi:predicted nucleic acid-binding protein
VTGVFSTVPLVIDTSAWARQSHPAVADRWRASLIDGLLAACPASSLEILRTARDEHEFERLSRALATLPQALLTPAVCGAALAASAVLRGQRRLPAVDYLIAAAAAERGFGVLHYDHDYDVLATALGFESVWIAPPGSVP